jgi:uncharacterized protein YegP (UPF0339 family)
MSPLFAHRVYVPLVASEASEPVVSVGPAVTAADGSAIAGLSVRPVTADSPPSLVSDGFALIGQAWDITVAGDLPPSARLAFPVPDGLPPGVAPSDLRLAFQLEDSSWAIEWEAAYDAARHVITVEVAHLSTWAVAFPDPTCLLPGIAESRHWSVLFYPCDFADRSAGATYARRVADLLDESYDFIVGLGYDMAPVPGPRHQVQIKKGYLAATNSYASVNAYLLMTVDSQIADTLPVVLTHEAFHVAQFKAKWWRSVVGSVFRKTWFDEASANYVAQLHRGVAALESAGHVAPACDSFVLPADAETDYGYLYWTLVAHLEARQNGFLKNFYTSSGVFASDIAEIERIAGVDWAALMQDYALRYAILQNFPPVDKNPCNGSLTQIDDIDAFHSLRGKAAGVYTFRLDKTRSATIDITTTGSTVVSAWALAGSRPVREVLPPTRDRAVLHLDCGAVTEAGVDRIAVIAGAGPSAPPSGQVTLSRTPGATCGSGGGGGASVSNIAWHVMETSSCTPVGPIPPGRPANQQHLGVRYDHAAIPAGAFTVELLRDGTSLHVLNDPNSGTATGRRVCFTSSVAGGSWPAGTYRINFRVNNVTIASSEVTLAAAGGASVSNIAWHVMETADCTLIGAIPPGRPASNQNLGVTYDHAAIPAGAFTIEVLRGGASLHVHGSQNSGTGTGRRFCFGSGVVGGSWAAGTYRLNFRVNNGIIAFTEVTLP